VGRLQALEWASQWDRVRFAAGNGRHVTRWLEGTSASPDSVKISLEPRASAARYMSPQPSQLSYLLPAAVAASVSAGSASIRSRSAGPCRAAGPTAVRPDRGAPGFGPAGVTV
jgi:hypothetical protein